MLADYWLLIYICVGACCGAGCVMAECSSQKWYDEPIHKVKTFAAVAAAWPFFTLVAVFRQLFTFR